MVKFFPVLCNFGERRKRFVLFFTLFSANGAFFTKALLNVESENLLQLFLSFNVFLLFRIVENWWNNSAVNCEYLVVFHGHGGEREFGCNCVIYDWFRDTAGSNAVISNSINYAVKTVWFFSRFVCVAWARRGREIDYEKGMKSIASHNKRFSGGWKIPLQFSLKLFLFDFSCWLPVRYAN